MKDIIDCAHSNYPSRKQILNNLGSVIKTLLDTKSKPGQIAAYHSYILSWKPNKCKRDYYSILENFNTNIKCYQLSRHFCNKKGHSSYQYIVYSSQKDILSRLN